jgi:hypothetical protein
MPANLRSEVTLLLCHFWSESPGAFMIRVKSAFHNTLPCSSGAECEAVQCRPISEVRSLYYYAISGRSLQAPQLLGLSLLFKIFPCSSGAECEAVQCQPGRGNALRHRTVFLHQVLHPIQQPKRQRQKTCSEVELLYRCTMKNRFFF